MVLLIDFWFKNHKVYSISLLTFLVQKSLGLLNITRSTQYHCWHFLWNISVNCHFFFNKSTFHTAWKVSKYGVISGPYFPVFGLNTEIYSLNLRIQYEYRKIRTRNNSVLWHFSRSDICSYSPILLPLA